MKSDNVSQVLEAERLKIQNVESFPNRLICYLQLRIIQEQKGVKYLRSDGTGCLIDDNYLLTAAHNFQNIDNYMKKNKDEKKIKEVNSVKQALKDGTGQGNYNIVKKWISSKYIDQNSQKKKLNDYALVRLEPELKPEHEGIESIEKFKQQFMPIMIISRQTAKKCNQFQLFGYPLRLAKQTYQKKNAEESIQNQISYIMAQEGNVYADKGQINQFTSKILKYDLFASEGVSGGPIITEYRGVQVIIGIHKGSADDQKSNVGISVAQMIQELNQWGFQERKKPFVFTQKTIHFKFEEQDLSLNEELWQLNRSYQPADILVLTGYDLTKLKKIFLSQNNIQRLGLSYLSRRQFPVLTTLLVNDNNIQTLLSIPESPDSDIKWKHFAQLQLLGLNSNKLKDLPKEMAELTNLQRLWLATNEFTSISSILLDVFKSAASNNEKQIHFQNNKIQSQNEENKQIISQLEKNKVKIHLSS